jgi:hypothetical protein
MAKPQYQKPCSAIQARYGHQKASGDQRARERHSGDRSCFAGYEGYRRRLRNWMSGDAATV